MLYFPPRLALLGPVRSEQQLSSSFLEAPFGRAAIAFMKAAGIDSLMAWNKDVAQQSLTIFQKTVQVRVHICSRFANINLICPLLFDLLEDFSFATLVVRVFVYCQSGVMSFIFYFCE